RRWLYRAISNLATDHFRRQRRFAGIRFWLPAPENPLELVDRWMEDDELAAALRELSKRERLAVYLSYYEDRPFGEIDHLVGGRPRTTRCRNGRRSHSPAGPPLWRLWERPCQAQCADLDLGWRRLDAATSGFQPTRTRGGLDDLRRRPRGHRDVRWNGP